MTEYHTRADMPERYARTLDQMMKSQAYRELAAAHMFGHGLKYVPELKWLKFMTWHIREEMEHYEVVAKMYAEFAGESVEPWVNARLAEKPIEFAESWFELAMAQFLYDRGGYWQLQEYENASFPRYREVIRKIIAEEKGHQGLGERIVVEMCQDPAYDGVKQSLFEKWLRYGLLSFGRPGGEGNAYAIAVGLKKRDSGEVMKDFIDDIRGAVRSSGLRWPEAGALGMELPEGVDWRL
ncbi:MAG: phenylacetate-CoA oxygenase subunit PaaI [Deltaproteobacteria bacterium]|nr:phenylacetate-CoA oxygenase subunit PaaI [Deltaproteobacteria bacterium]